MRTPEILRAKAARAERMAEYVGQEDRNTLLTLAREWRKTADRLERQEREARTDPETNHR
jgi:hypothetical protein